MRKKSGGMVQKRDMEGEGNQVWWKDAQGTVGGMMAHWRERRVAECLTRSHLPAPLPLALPQERRPLRVTAWRRPLRSSPRPLRVRRRRLRQARLRFLTNNLPQRLRRGAWPSGRRITAPKAAARLLVAGMAGTRASACRLLCQAGIRCAAEVRRVSSGLRVPGARVAAARCPVARRRWPDGPSVGWEPPLPVGQVSTGGLPRRRLARGCARAGEGAGSPAVFSPPLRRGPAARLPWRAGRRAPPLLGRATGRRGGAGAGEDVQGVGDGVGEAALGVGSLGALQQGALGPQVVRLVRPLRVVGVQRDAALPRGSMRRGQGEGRAG